MKTKEELYSDICELLTAYEVPEDDIWNRSKEDFLEDFYHMLCRVQNAWAEITHPADDD